MQKIYSQGKKVFATASGLVLGAAVSVPAFAQVDAEDVTAIITGNVTTLVAVGNAVLVLVGVMAVFGAIFGLMKRR